MTFGASENGLILNALFMTLETDGANGEQLAMIREAALKYGRERAEDGYLAGAEAMRRLLLEKVERTKTEELTEES